MNFCLDVDPNIDTKFEILIGTKIIFDFSNEISKQEFHNQYYLGLNPLSVKPHLSPFILGLTA